jgi:hypothetical protein
MKAVFLTPCCSIERLIGERGTGFPQNGKLCDEHHFYVMNALFYVMQEYFYVITTIFYVMCVFLTKRCRNLPCPTGRAGQVRLLKVQSARRLTVRPAESEHV